jgi:thioredoxin-related protein
MKNYKSILIASLVLFFLGNCFAQTSYNFNDGLSKAKSSNKKVLISIYVDGNSWCDKMSSVYSSENIKNYINNNFIFVRLNGQGSEKCTYNGKQYTESELSKFFGATGYPTHVFLESDGTVIKYKYNGEMCNNYSGYVESGEFEKILKYFAANQYKDTDLAKIL